MNTIFMRLAGVAIGTSIVAAGAGMADEFAEQTMVAPVVIAPVETISDWSGAYVGGGLGYSFKGDDTVGLSRFNASGERVMDDDRIGALDSKGVNARLHMGYRWQKINWVFGPELGIEGGSVDSSDSITGVGTSGDIVSKLNYLVSLRLKSGYGVGPNALLYATLGAVYGDFDYDFTRGGVTQEGGFSDTGLSAGFGVERKLSDSLSMYAEYEYRHFGKTEVNYADVASQTLQTVASPSLHNVNLGVNFRF